MDSRGITRCDALRRGDRGAVAVEMAIVVPLLVLLAFGMLEFGLAFTNKLAMSSAVNRATRQATVLGTDEYADIEILDALAASLSGNVGTIEHVDIFKADAGGNPVLRDRYVPDGGSACGWLPCPDPSLGPAIYGAPADYAPCTRDVKLGDGTVDTIGVQVAYTHTWITGVFGIPPQTWFETARARLEPDIFGSGGAPCP
ncbi:MAG: hypothetical protein BMS9Abin07_0005 [Acidimicrobiia bacterium]|nr:MAG: hypothetical protein BMS9Abin07_0005 [Acidimicrobiia bacterium]